MQVGKKMQSLFQLTLPSTQAESRPLIKLKKRQLQTFFLLFKTLLVRFLLRTLGLAMQKPLNVISLR